VPNRRHHAHRRHAGSPRRAPSSSPQRHRARRTRWRIGAGRKAAFMSETLSVDGRGHRRASRPGIDARCSRGGRSPHGTAQRSRRAPCERSRSCRRSTAAPRRVTSRAHAPGDTRFFALLEALRPTQVHHHCAGGRRRAAEGRRRSRLSTRSIERGRFDPHLTQKPSRALMVSLASARCRRESAAAVVPCPGWGAPTAGRFDAREQRRPTSRRRAGASSRRARLRLSRASKSLACEHLMGWSPRD
jgi:hypothetical protein